MHAAMQHWMPTCQLLLYMLSLLEGVQTYAGMAFVAMVTKPANAYRFASIRIGPVIVSSADEVVAVFNNMKADERLKWFL